jgi:hypothetical protein
VSNSVSCSETSASAAPRRSDPLRATVKVEEEMECAVKVEEEMEYITVCPCD